VSQRLSCPTRKGASRRCAQLTPYRARIATQDSRTEIELCGSNTASPRPVLRTCARFLLRSSNQPQLVVPHLKSDGERRSDTARSRWSKAGRGWLCSKPSGSRLPPSPSHPATTSSTCCDDGISGSKHEEQRPALAELLAAVRAGEVSVVRSNRAGLPASTKR
jgi:hypothetical protein